jgi:hypothetical protein
MLLYHIFLCLSLTTNVLSSEQDILGLDPDRLLLSSRNLVTKICFYDSKPALHGPTPTPPLTTGTSMLSDLPCF